VSQLDKVHETSVSLYRSQIGAEVYLTLGYSRLEMSLGTLSIVAEHGMTHELLIQKDLAICSSS